MEREEGEEDPGWIASGVRDEGAFANERLVPLGEAEDGPRLIPRAGTVIGGEVDDPVGPGVVLYPLGGLTMGEAEEDDLHLIDRGLIGECEGESRKHGRRPRARARGGKDHLNPVVMGEDSKELLPRIAISSKNPNPNSGRTGGLLGCVHALIYAKMARRVNVGPCENGAMRDRCRSRRATRRD
jgi:hypothetical protein